jgi:hypothetical protein
MSEPSWNFTPRRRRNSQVVGLMTRQDSASPGSICSRSPEWVSVSKTCLSDSEWVPVAV